MTAEDTISRHDILITAVVCTYNRAVSLQALLETISKQELRFETFEVLVIDNSSTDRTRMVVSKATHQLPNLRYAFESKQGLSHARNRGWMEAKGRYVGFVDDDCQVPPQWLRIATGLIERYSPTVFGGPYKATFSSPKPGWFRDIYGESTLGTEPRWLEDGEYLSGGNFFMRRSVFQEIGGFDPKLGVSGETPGFGEETDLLRRIRMKLPEAGIYYEPELYVFHSVGAKKMQLSWVARIRFADGRYSFRIFREAVSTGKGSRSKLSNWIGRLRVQETSSDIRRYFNRVVIALVSSALIIRILLDLILGTLLRDRRAFRYSQNYWYERTLKHFHTLGWLYEQLLSNS